MYIYLGASTGICTNLSFVFHLIISFDCIRYIDRSAWSLYGSIRTTYTIININQSKVLIELNIIYY